MQHTLRAGTQHFAGRGNSTFEHNYSLGLSRETADFDSLQVTTYASSITG